MPARTMAPMVGRDVPGAPRPRGRHRERYRGRHVYAGRRGRRPLPTCTIHTMSTHHAHTMSTHHAHAMPTRHARMHHGTHGRARRPRRAAPTGTTSGTTSGTTQARGPPGTSAPTIMHNAYHVHAPCTRHARTPAPCPYPRTMPARHTTRHGRARRPRRAAPTGTTSGTTSGTRAAGEQDGAGVFSRRRASNGGRTGRVP